MEKCEVNITYEESRNYHNFFAILKSLSLNNWVKAYIGAVVYTVLLCALMMYFFQNEFVSFWYNTSLTLKLLIFLVIFIMKALRKSKIVQLNALLMKYFLQAKQQEILAGKIQLKKIKVEKDKLLVYFRRRTE